MLEVVQLPLHCVLALCLFVPKSVHTYRVPSMKAETSFPLFRAGLCIVPGVGWSLVGMKQFSLGEHSVNRPNSALDQSRTGFMRRCLISGNASEACCA